jgi:hypothetical protein
MTVLTKNKKRTPAMTQRYINTTTQGRTMDYFSPGDVIRIGNSPTLDDVRYVRPVDRYIASMDVGKSIDNSAIAIMHHTIRALDQFANDLKRGVSKQLQEERFHIVHLERLPLGMAYPTQIAHVKALMAREPLVSGNAPLVIDQTGCGAPVADMFAASGLRNMQRVSITAGDQVNGPSNGNEWHVPKGILISTLESRIHSAEFKVAPALSEAGALKEELLDFERHVSDSGRATWGARTGKHDDIVLACSLACWWAVRTARPNVEHLPNWQHENLAVRR